MSSKILFLTLKLLIVVEFGNSDPTRNARIVGGSDAPAGAYPHHAGLLAAIQGHYYNFCGGSIINENWILTAAHCVALYPATQLGVIVGTNMLNDPNSSLHTVESVVRHENFTANDPYDIGLVKLATPVVYSDLIQAIALETEFVDSESQLLFSGWGRIQNNGPQPNNLQHITFSSINNTLCNEKALYPTTDAQICTWGPQTEAPCAGDSGGALVNLNKTKQVGIASQSLCGRMNIPHVFIRVSTYVSWINQQIGN